MRLNSGEASLPVISPHTDCVMAGVELHRLCSLEKQGHFAKFLIVFSSQIGAASKSGESRAVGGIFCLLLRSKVIYM